MVSLVLDVFPVSVLVVVALVEMSEKERFPCFFLCFPISGLVL